MTSHLRSADLTRRQFFANGAIGLGVPALALLLANDLSADDKVNDGWRLVRRLKVSENPVFCVRFSPDDKRLATTSTDTLQIWNAEDGTSHARYDFETGVVCVAYSPDGKQIGVGHLDGTATLVDLEVGKNRTVLKGHAGILRVDETVAFSTVRAVCFSPDGKTVATGAYDGRVKLWDAVTGKEIAVFERHGDWIHEVAFSPDGKLVASAADTANVWDVATGTLRHSLRIHDGHVRSVAFSPDGKTLATSGADHSLKLWNVGTGQERATTVRHDGTVYSVVFSPDGELLLTGSEDQTAKLWDVRTATLRATLSDHTDQVFSTTFSHNGKLLATASHDGTMAIYKATATSDRKSSQQRPASKESQRE